MNIRRCWGWRAVMAGAAVTMAARVLAAGPVTLNSLLAEMVDRDGLAKFPEPAYTCKQFSSYDRASTTPDDPKTWFANGDCSQYLRVEEVPGPGAGRHKEWVMADMDGPGAIVRFWSANPKGSVRIYLDGAKEPVVVAPMSDLLGGKWKTVDAPLSQECSKGWNLYLPIPYAKHCKVTSDEDGFYYQINYRTYAAGTAVESFTPSSVEDSAQKIQEAQDHLSNPRFLRDDNGSAKYTPIEPGAMGTIVESARGPGAVQNLIIWLRAADLTAALRSSVLVGEFDGEQTVWCPVGDFFGQASGPIKFHDWYISADGERMQTLFVMPYSKSVKLTLLNLGKQKVEFARTCMTGRGDDWWTDRSMHFHAAWHAQYPIHAYGARGTMDWNYVDVKGKGVYVGDSLAVMNPVPDWWGEGDEKIYVDGEKFPSHFGTGTEDYYGYAWCWPVPFMHPFHAEARADGHVTDGSRKDTNWGHTTVTRVRALDAIPFAQSLKFDMEIWHWKECDEAYAATTYFYAMPGATTNRKPQPEEAAKPIPQPPPLPPPPPPFKIAGAIECEGMKVVSKSEGLTVVPQDMADFERGKWSGETQLWVQGRKPGDYVELEVPAGAGPEGQKPMNFILYATRSWDYGQIKFSVNGHPSDVPEELFSGAHGKVMPTGPIHLGVFKPQDGRFILRAEVAGGNEQAEGSRSFFGLDCVVLTPATDADLRGPGGVMDDDHAPGVKH